MAHPLFRLAASKPQLLAEHALAYCDLLGAELTGAARLLQRKLALQVVAATCLAASGLLAGVALMLWAALPQGSLHLPWLLVAVPAAPAVLGYWALTKSQTMGSGDLFLAVRKQLADDAAMLRASAAADTE
jgi:uncharacterized membrane protein YqjE